MISEARDAGLAFAKFSVRSCASRFASSYRSRPPPCLLIMNTRLSINVSWLGEPVNCCKPDRPESRNDSVTVGCGVGRRSVPSKHVDWPEPRQRDPTHCA